MHVLHAIAHGVVCINDHVRLQCCKVRIYVLEVCEWYTEIHHKVNILCILCLLKDNRCTLCNLSIYQKDILLWNLMQKSLPLFCMQLFVLLCYILVLLLYRIIKFIPVIMLKILLYQYHNFLWLRGGHDVINKVVSTETYQPSCMVKVNN